MIKHINETVDLSQGKQLFDWYQVMDDIHFAALQGKKNPETDEGSVKSFLDQVMKAKEMKIDK